MVGDQAKIQGLGGILNSSQIYVFINICLKRDELLVSTSLLLFNRLDTVWQQTFQIELLPFLLSKCTALVQQRGFQKRGTRKRNVDGAFFHVDTVSVTIGWVCPDINMDCSNLTSKPERSENGAELCSEAGV